MYWNPVMAAATRKKLTDSDYIKLSNFRYTLRKFLEFSESAAANEGLTPQQHQALLAIRGNPEDFTSVGYLAERLRIRPNTAAELSQRLEQVGLIERRANETDRRQVDLDLTRLGLEKLEALTRTHRAELAQLKPELLRFLESLEVEA